MATERGWSGDIVERFEAGALVGVVSNQPDITEQPGILTERIQVNGPFSMQGATLGTVKGIDATYEETGYLHVVIRVEDASGEVKECICRLIRGPKQEGGET